MEDETLGFFKKTSSSHARLNVPALVQVAALAIIMIRGLDVLMIFNTLGVRGIGEFIHRSVQTWSLTLVFLSSLVLVFIEIWCALSTDRNDSDPRRKVRTAYIDLHIIRGDDYTHYCNWKNRRLVEGTNSSIRMSISGSFCSIRLWKISRFDSPGMLNSSG
jgi:hypothetical protein